eukprot:SAG25_NODE_2337_length_1702_cov_1.232689_3_plen_46_part_00
MAATCLMMWLFAGAKVRAVTWVQTDDTPVLAVACGTTVDLWRLRS